MEHVRQSRLVSGLGLYVKVLETFKFCPHSQSLTHSLTLYFLSAAGAAGEAQLESQAAHPVLSDEDGDGEFLRVRPPPMSSKVKAGFWPWLSGESPETLLS